MKKFTRSLLFWVTEGLLLIALCAGFCFAFLEEAGAAWDGSAASSFASGTGTEKNPYLIKTTYQMGYFMEQLAAGVTYNGMYIQLENNLDMTGAVWNYSHTTAFEGVFNGNGYTITADCPLFYKIGAEGVLKGLNYTTIHTTLDRALLCEYNFGVIDSCVGYGDVDNWEAAIICKDNRGTVTNCGAIGQLKALGGDAYAAMICYNQGSVSNCFSALSLSAEETEKYGEAFPDPLVAQGAAPVNCYYDKTLYTGTTTNGLGITTEEMKSAAFLSSLTGTSVVGTNWVTGSHGYPALAHCSSDYAYVDGYQGEASILYFGAYQTFTLKASNSSAKVYYTLDGSDPTTSRTAKYVTSGKTVTITGNAVLTMAPYYNGSYGSITKVDITFLIGEGTAANPYQLSNAKQLKTLALFPDQCFKLVSDITLTDADYAIGGIMVGGWHPVTEFAGVLEGAEHAIVNLQGSHGGLIVTNHGTVTALRLLDHKLYRYGDYGAIATNNYGSITYCYVRSGFTLDTLPPAATSAAYDVGGIASYNRGTLTHCRNDGITLFTGANEYSSRASVGGIAGVEFGTLTHCINTGKIVLQDYLRADYGLFAGIAGRGWVENCLSSTDFVSWQEFGYRFYVNGIALDHTSSGVSPSGRYCISKLPKYSFLGSNSASPYISDLGYDLETSKVPADCPDLDFENNWMITSEGLVPQGVMNADGHCFVPNGEAVLSTCTENGSAPVICLTCGKTEVQTLQLLDHAWSEPTCTEGSVCTDCGEVGAEALGHNYVDGYCENCGVLQIVANGTCGDNLTWTLDAVGKLTISGNGDMDSASSVLDYPWSVYRDQILSVVIEEGITTVGRYAFQGYLNLNTVKLPDGLTSINDFAFQNCSISGIEFPESVTTIGIAAFNCCNQLKTLIIPASVNQIVGQAFSGCSALESIVIPVSVQRLYGFPFASCTSLREIHFTGTKAQWDAIEKDSTWDQNSGDYTVYYAPCDPADHVWVDATCTEPKTCSICGTTEGEPAHQWVNATCTEPKTCSVCGETEGEPLGHSYMGNSIACIRCGLDRVAYGNCGEDVKWVLDTNGLLTIYGTGEMYWFDQGGAPWYGYRTTTTAAEILDGVTSIGDAAFYAFYKLERIAMADSIVSIGNYAFKDCRVLDGVQLPADLNEIMSYAFENCGRLTNIVIPDGVTWLSDFAFMGCTSLQSAVLPKGITSIPQWLFYGCSSLTGIVIPEGVTNISNAAFSGCSSLEYAVLPEGIATIDSFVFFNCSKLQSIEIPGSVSAIGDHAFSGCSSLQSIVIPEGVTEIGEMTFEKCSSLRSAEIPEGVLSIGGNAFADCSSLESVVIPSSVTSVGECAFSDCSSLESVVIYGDITSIGAYTFSGCSRLQSIVIPDSVSSVGDYAFQYCESLRSIVIPDDVAEIGDMAFQNCSSLRSVEIPKGVRSIGEGMFRNCSSLQSVLIPEGIICIGADAFAGCSKLESVVLPEGVISIGGGAFIDCNSLRSVVIPEGVTSIGVCAFMRCSSLENVMIPAGVTDIGNGAFAYCENLKSVVILEGGNSIGRQAFVGCSHLESVVILEGVTYIGEYAFQNCSELQYLMLPDSLMSIDRQAFDGCYALWHVFYGGTEETWNQIVIDENCNGYLTGQTRHYECTGEETLDLETGVCSVCASICEHEWIEATCETPKTCPLCGSVDGDALGHDFQLTVDPVPTVKTAGTLAVECATCGQEHFAELPALNAQDYSYQVIQPATAMTDGVACYTWNNEDYGVVRFYELLSHSVSQQDAQLVIQSATTLAGNTIRLEVLLQNNPGLQGIYGWLQYDASVLELISVENGTVLENLTVGSYLVWDAEQNTVEDGVLCVLEFRVAENAVAGEYFIGLVLEEVLNDRLESVPLHMVYSTVKVINMVYGDANNDGLVSLKDVLLLRQHLANRDPDTGVSTVAVEAGADANGDGVINLKDVLLLRKYLANRDPSTGESTVVLGP